jgi:PST family polysaccharide transporter
MRDRTISSAIGGRAHVERASFAAVDDASGAQNRHSHHFETGHLLANLKGRTVSNGFITLVAQSAQFGVTLGSTMVLARILAPQDFGLIAMVTTILGFLRVFKEAGLSTATVQREGITHAQVSNLFWVNVALSGAISLIVAVSAPLIAWFYREPRLFNITLLLSLTFLFEGSAVQHIALLNRQMRFKALALIQVSSLMAGVAIGIGMASSGCGYWSLVGFQLTTSLSTFVLAWSTSRWRPQWPTRFSGTRPLLSFGANLTASTLIWSLARGADSLLVGKVFGPASVGLYSRAGALLMRPMEQFISPIQTVFVPTFSRLQERPQHYRDVFLRLYRTIAVASLLFTAILLALSRPLTLFVLGPKWQQAAPIFAGFTIAALIYPVASASGWLFTSQGRGKDWLLAITIASVATIGSFIAGMPFGPAGVAFSFSLSGIFLQLPILFYLGGRSGPVSTKDLCTGFLEQIPLWVVVCSVTWAVLKMANGLSLISQLVIPALAGLLAGAVTIWIYPPSHATMRDLLVVLKDWEKFRKASA